MPEKSIKEILDSVIIKSRAIILTRVQSKAYTEPPNLVVSVPCLTCRVARTFTTLAKFILLWELCLTILLSALRTFYFYII